jgi:LPS-assembly protein
LARSFSFKPLVWALAAAFGAAGAQAADDLSLGRTCLSCSPEKLGEEAAAHAAPEIRRSGEAPLPADYTRISADEVAGQTNVTVRAEGDVIVERNDQVLNAKWVDYNQSSDVVTAGEGFTLYQNGTTISGSKIEYNLTEGSGSSTDTRLDAEHDGRRFQSVSERAQMQGNGRYTLTNTLFNTCQPGDASWYIKAKSIEADQNTGIGVAQNATLVFGGVPVLYTPWADFPLNGNRKSGLLVPALKISSDGVEVETPYYLNLAPNYDATITPGIITGRGVQLGAQFRYLQPTYAGRIQGKWMPDDRRSEHNNRAHLIWQHQQQFTPTLSGGIDYNQVSDNDYYRDFYGRDDIASNVNLNRQAWLNHNTRLWGGTLDSYATVQKYQTLANSDGYKTEPYCHHAAFFHPLAKAAGQRPNQCVRPIHPLRARRQTIGQPLCGLPEREMGFPQPMGLYPPQNRRAHLLLRSRQPRWRIGAHHQPHPADFQYRQRHDL